MLPATPWGVWEIIKRTGLECLEFKTGLSPVVTAILRLCLSDFSLFFTGIPTLGKNVVVAGRSKNVGMPIAMLLHTDGRHERPGGKNSTLCFYKSLCNILHVFTEGLDIGHIFEKKKKDSYLVQRNAGVICCSPCFRRCDSYHFPPLHSKGATSPAHKNR